MKWAILVGDGMADRPLEALGGRTPLQAARTPWMDEVAKRGFVGLVRTIPPGFSPGSDIANLVIMGYDPAVCYTGRGPLEAAAMGVSLGVRDVAFRCNLVHLDLWNPEPTMVDFTAGHISTGESRPIIEALNEAFEGVPELHAGVSYRHLMVWRGGVDAMHTTPPHDITGQRIQPHLPQGRGSDRLRAWIKRSQRLLGDAPLRDRVSPGNPHPPNSIWPWGQGRAPNMEPMTRSRGVRGAVVTAVDLLKGIGVYAGLDVVEVPGATGYYDTDYAGKSAHALAALDEDRELVFVHVEAPDEAGHEGDLGEKIRAIEAFDREVVGRILEGLGRWREWGLMVLPDHPTPIAVRTHTAEPVPFAVCYSHGPEGSGERFDEAQARESNVCLEDGLELLPLFLEGGWTQVKCRS